MEPDDGALLLLRSAKVIDENESLNEAPTTDQEKAKEISEAVGGLPLALDQAGAFIRPLAKVINRGRVHSCAARRLN